MWFQPEIPNPGVDLSKLYKIDSSDDGYPYELKELIINPNFQGEITTKIDENFISDDLKDERFFTNLLYEDQYKTKHYPMKFLSQITSPDILNLEYMDKDNIGVDKYILSLSEIANFVRCIPLRRGFENYELWCSPDFTLTLKCGSVIDHAILMAWMFQGTIFEDHRDQEEVMEILRSNKTKQKLAKFAKFKSKHFQTPLKDRVFVCLGKLGPENDSKKYAWVMTISRNYETVTFWDPIKPIKYVLEGRINYKETKWLQNYLSPILTSKEKNLERQVKRKKQKAEQMKKQEELIKKQKEQEQTLKSTQGKPKTSKFNFNLNRSLLLNINSIWSSGIGVWGMGLGVYEWADGRKYDGGWELISLEKH